MSIIRRKKRKVKSGCRQLKSCLSVQPAFFGVGITKTASVIPAYENSMAMGLILFNLLSLYQPDLQWTPQPLVLLIIHIGSFLTGIFAGCLVGALAEVVNTIPIFSRRVNLRKGFPYMVKAAAIGKCIGCLIQFYKF